jgi:uncharacterized HAD superfamily protein
MAGQRRVFLIALDVDEVLADFLAKLLEYHNQEYGSRLRREDFYTYDWWHVWGGSSEEAFRKFYQFMLTPLAEAVEPMPGAIEGVRALKRAGHRLEVITGRPKQLSYLTQEWLDRWFGKLIDGFHSTDMHIFNHGHDSKGTLCRDLRADLLIDDMYKYGEECLDFSVPFLLYDSPWNRAYPLRPGMRRAKNWPEIVNIVDDMSII